MAGGFEHVKMDGLEGNWVREDVMEGVIVLHRVNECFHTSKSKFQDVAVADMGSWGRVLVLDGKVQSSLNDEYIYHESLVHPALLAHPNPKTVFIGGGGEGATAREVLRHKSVETVVMADIDEVVVEFCKKFVGSDKGAFDDPRLDLRIDDAKAQLLNYPGKFDVYIGDLADPLEAGPCYQLYTEEYYKLMAAKLNPGAIVVTQSGPCGSDSCKDVFTPIHNTLKQIYPRVCGYTSHVPSFMDSWGFNVAFTDAATVSPADMSIEQVDELIASRLKDGTELEWLDGVTMRSMFGLSKRHRKLLKEEKRVMTEANPLFIF